LDGFNLNHAYGATFICPLEPHQIRLQRIIGEMQPAASIGAIQTNQKPATLGSLTVPTRSYQGSEQPFDARVIRPSR
jgi:hypothetical protein